ncbi:MAG: glutamate racemase, partial [Burkholderiaceae bacterium]|nr:glutamate racemase [Burkholderiaceae bacterium]
MPNHPDSPIGVFDSGVGGLSVLAALRAELPHERFCYFSDAGYAPYGERGDDFVIARSRAIARLLIEQRGIKALVVACNTATAAAIGHLRADWPELPLIGVEPALKPGAAVTRTGHVGVLATRGTLGSAKFRALHGSLSSQTAFHLVACDGLASAIERGDAARIDELAARYLGALGPLGTGEGQIDTLVLGCTHYPFAAATLRRYANPDVRLIDTGAPVATQTRRLLAARGALRSGDDCAECALTLETSGPPEALQTAAARWAGWTQWDLQPA